MVKNDTQISGFTFVKKASSPWKTFFFKKMLPAYLCRQDLQNYVGNFFKINVAWDILIFDDFAISKYALHNSIINKTQTTKNQENSAHCKKNSAR